MSQKTTDPWENRRREKSGCNNPDCARTPMFGDYCPGCKPDNRCPQCGYEYDDVRRLKNGEWAMEYVTIDGYMCAEWFDEDLRIWIHDED